MPIDFPDSPSENDTYTTAGKTWIYSSGKWIASTAMPNFGDSSITAASIQSGAATTAKFADSVITAAKLANSSVTAGKMSASSPLITICTSSTRPNAPVVGQAIFETDTNLMKFWLGSGWSGGDAHVAA